MTTPDTMKNYYRDPLIAMSIIACVLFIVLLVLCIKHLRRSRGQTVYKTVNITPKKVQSRGSPLGKPK